MYQPLQISVYDVEADFDLTVMQISDLHDYKFKANDIQKALSYEPDIIVITGDFIDRNRFDLDHSLKLLDLLEDYPIFYVTGNHEAWSNRTDEIVGALKSRGVNVLRDSSMNYKGLVITGVDDPAYRKPIDIPKSDILLAHRSDMIPLYTYLDVDVVFTGHAHGGQFRFFGQGIFSPGQGFMPKYTSGVHVKSGTSAVISRGLGNSKFPIRLFNPPEIVIAKIYKK